MKYVAVSVAAAFLGGCAASPQDAAKMSDWELARAIGGANMFVDPSSPAVAEELVNRNTFTPEEWYQIRNKQFVIGQRKIVTMAVAGNATKVREFTDAFGTTEVWQRGTDAERLWFRDGKLDFIAR